MVVVVNGVCGWVIVAVVGWWLMVMLVSWLWWLMVADGGDGLVGSLADGSGDG